MAKLVVAVPTCQDRSVKSALRRIIVLAFIGAVITGLLVIVAGPANVQVAPAAVSDSVRSACTDFSYDKVWQTSRKWGRARERSCVDYTDSQIRGYVQFQIDWPLDCMISVGFPPSGSGGCPLSRATKEPSLILKTLEVSFNWEYLGISPIEGRCDWSDIYFGNMSQGYQPVTVSCYSVWAPVIKGGKYYIDIIGVKADVQDDGDPPKQLHPFQQAWFERGGDFYWEAVK